jgi:asparagine synthase (glutamine-hydrolysing)
MCGICVSNDVTVEIEASCQKLMNRGPDQVRQYKDEQTHMLFHRLAIMDLSQDGMQPFEKNRDRLYVANAEIYNYKQLKSAFNTYPYTSSSDCEVLIPLYERYGVSMFKMLDAEFAIVIFDRSLNQIVAARDPIGIRPLFYGYSKENNQIMFASEAKALIEHVIKVRPFPPGHYYLDGHFIKYRDLTQTNFYNDNEEAILVEIKDLLTKAVIKRLDADAKVGFLLSGGLDSSLVCMIAQAHLNKPITTFSIGMKKDPIDLKYAFDVAKLIHSNHHEVKMSETEVIQVLDELIYALETYDITTIRASIGMFLLSKYIKENTDIKVLLTGEISDELFGYKYTDFAPNAKAFQNECKKRIDEVYMYDVLRADRCLAYHSLEARVPFGDLDFVEYVMHIDPKLKMNRYQMGKHLLRKAFDSSLLPHHILYRDKAAFSDAVGHSMVDALKAYAEEVYDDATFEIKKQLYKKPTPHTKEALLYREIFEKHYPNHHHMIKGYWMPNSKWKGCKVSDPSARYLSNYNLSGL